jgi:hypothetical protein
MNVKYPYMRVNIYGIISLLANGEAQRRAIEDPEGFLDDPESFLGAHIDTYLSFLFDSTTLVEDPIGNIGFVLENEEEAIALQKIVKIIEDVIKEIDDYGDYIPNETYIQHRLWGNVISSSKELLQIMNKNPPMRT